MRFLLSSLLCCFLFSCQKDFSGLENAPSLPTYLNGEWELVAQERNGVLESVERDECGLRDKLKLSIPAEGEVYISDHIFIEKEQYLGKGNYDICTVNPNNYRIERQYNGCNTGYYFNPDNPIQWTSYSEGPCLYYLASWQKNHLTLQVKDNIHERGYIPGGITKFIYHKL